MVRSTWLAPATALAFVASMVAAAAETVPIPRPKPDPNAVEVMPDANGTPGVVGTETAAVEPSDQTDDGTRSLGLRPSLSAVLSLSDQEIIDRYGVGADLSRSASLIVAVIAATNDVKANCQTRASMKAMMEPVVQGLERQGRLQGRTFFIATEAGRYIYFNCDSF